MNCGTAMAARMAMMPTTIISSMSVNPLRLPFLVNAQIMGDPPSLVESGRFPG
jgi:hypothetical protein